MLHRSVTHNKLKVETYEVKREREKRSLRQEKIV